MEENKAYPTAEGTIAKREQVKRTVLETLEEQLQLLSERSKTCEDDTALAALSREMQNIVILMTGVNRYDIQKGGYR